MSSILHRIYTYLQWPPDAPVNCLSLAQAGFVYDGSGLRTRCEVCRTVIDNWQRGDIPLERHKITAPRCPLVATSTTSQQWTIQSQTCNQEAATHLAPSRLQTDNLPQTFQKLTVDARQSRSTAVSGSYQSDGESSGTETQNISDQTEYQSQTGATADPPSRRRLPRNAQFNDVTDRIASFPCHHLDSGQTVDSLATAGFYYIGPGDRVQCFWCNGIVKNWRPSDEPWTVHAKYFSRCRYLRQHKDAQFIASCSNSESQQNLSVSSSQHAITPAAAAAASQLPDRKSVV